jgi:hypothetical protein
MNDLMKEAVQATGMTWAGVLPTVAFFVTFLLVVGRTWMRPTDPPPLE